MALVSANVAMREVARCWIAVLRVCTALLGSLTEAGLLSKFLLASMASKPRAMPVVV